MKLSDYLIQNGLTATEFAARAGCSISTITRAMRGEVVPNKATMDKIVAAAFYAVEPNDFYGSSQGGQPERPKDTEQVTQAKTARAS